MSAAGQRGSPFPNHHRSAPFAVALDPAHASAQSPFSARDLEDLVARCPVRPDSRSPYPRGGLKLGFRNLSNALEALTYFWRRSLQDPRSLPIPSLLSSQRLPDPRKPPDLLRDLFASHARSLLEGPAVRGVSGKVDSIDEEIKSVNALLAGKNSVKAFLDLQQRKTGLVEERGMLADRMEEFRAAIRSMIAWIEDEGKGDGSGVEAFGFADWMDWPRLRCSMLRECRRLEEGLPIYGCRRMILDCVKSNQVTVLIGETGSGKSTQLVQFLADSGLAADGSILCTQPRRLAALSLAQRVGAEGSGCYPNKFIVSYPMYSSIDKFCEGIIFLTDNCLLQHLMNNMNLKGISYIIVDEAHERSLNTDLLLALLKKQLLLRPDLRLIIMSATADASKLSEYFYGCQTLYVKGRTFPVNLKYVPDVSGEASWASITRKVMGNISSYVLDVVKMVSIIHETEESGDILAFLTAQMEVEWACEHFCSSSAIVLPLHGKLSCEEQSRVFKKYPGKRKVIFCTNIAETSLTIAGVKYVVDCGMVKESRFVASSGMNVLSVCSVSQSSAKQRAGRAGRTEPGKCYRLYSEVDFNSMALHQEPEIRKVHLGIAVLKILALGVTNLEEFEFIDSPSTNAIDMAVRNLIRLGAVNYNANNAKALVLTHIGRKLVKLGVEPRLGKVILDSFDCALGKEGVVLAAVMTNSSSIFCRVGTDEDKAKADCLKVPFCHNQGDLFTLLSVYKQWEQGQDRNQWCWQNSINAKCMRRCRDTVSELEICLKRELNIIIPSFWRWDPSESVYDGLLKKVILHCLPENVAMYSGCERLGYEVALTGEHLQLHPSSSLLIFGNKPDWVVFGDILSSSKEYLVCVTAIDRESLCAVESPLFDVIKLENHKMQMTTISGISNHLLRRLCGKGNLYLRSLISQIQMTCEDRRADIIIDFEAGVIQLFAPVKDMESASSLLNMALACETKWLRDECIERFLFRGMKNAVQPVALFGSGAEIKHLELQKRYLTVELSHPCAQTIDDKKLLWIVDQVASGIAGFSKLDQADSEKWGKITFLNPTLAEMAVDKLNQTEFCGSFLKVCPLKSVEGDHRLFPSHPVKAKLFWPRRQSKGVAFIRCDLHDVGSIVRDFSNLVIRGKPVQCEASRRFADSVTLRQIDKDVLEAEIYDALRLATRRRIVDVQLLRMDPVDHPSINAYEDALLREISPFLSGRKVSSRICHVEVFSPEPKDYMMKAMLTFDGSLHLEAAKALDHLQGKTLPGWQPWQKISCQQLFRSSISCSARIYAVIKTDLDALLKRFKHCKGASCELDRNDNGSYRVRITANATKKIADLRKPLELLMEGRTINNTSLTPAALELLFSRDGRNLMISVERETGTYIFFDRQKNSLKIFGSQNKVSAAEHVFVKSLLALHMDKQLEIPLLSCDHPPNLLQAVIQRFGPDLHGLKEKVPGAEFHIKNTRCQKISVRGSMEQKDMAEKVISELAKSLGSWSPTTQLETTCAICLCELEEPYKLGDCGHEFCRNCLSEQCESAMRSHDGFPLCCTRKGCKAPFLLADLRLLLSADKLDELFKASLGAFVASSAGAYKFCPSPDCPSIYKVADSSETSEPFICGACSAETCTKCHLEYHAPVSCDLYRKFKNHPDSSLMEWRKGKEHVKNCPVCGYTIEKIDGCNHIACKCGKHICWVCLASSDTSDECYSHLREVHLAII